MLEDMNNATEENEKEDAYNVLTSEMLEEILKESNKEEKEKEEIGHVNVIQSNEKLFQMLEKLLQRENRNNNNSNNNNNNKPGKMAWRKVAPKQGEEETKTFEGINYKWCGKCRRGEGLWTKGDGLHGTADHDPSKRKK